MEQTTELFCENCDKDTMHSIREELETSDGADEIHCSNFLTTVKYYNCIYCGNEYED